MPDLTRHPVSHDRRALLFRRRRPASASWKLHSIAREIASHQPWYRIRQGVALAADTRSQYADLSRSDSSCLQLSFFHLADNTLHTGPLSDFAFGGGKARLPLEPVNNGCQDSTLLPVTKQSTCQDKKGTLNVKVPGRRRLAKRSQPEVTPQEAEDARPSKRIHVSAHDLCS